jgi:hypothetical protein
VASNKFRKPDGRYLEVLAANLPLAECPLAFSEESSRRLARGVPERTVVGTFGCAIGSKEDLALAHRRQEKSIKHYSARRLRRPEVALDLRAAIEPPPLHNRTYASALHGIAGAPSSRSWSNSTGQLERLPRTPTTAESQFPASKYRYRRLTAGKWHGGYARARAF